MNTFANMGVLIFESDPVMRSVLCDIVEQAGCVVRVAKDLGVAVRKIHEVAPDLLIVSPYVDSMPGQEAANFLRQDCPTMDILMVAGFPADDRLANRARNDGIKTFPPPYHPQTLLDRVKELLIARVSRASY